MNLVYTGILNLSFQKVSEVLKFDFFFTVNRSLAANTILNGQLNIVPQPAELLFLQTLFPVLQALFTSRSGKLIAFYNILVGTCSELNIRRRFLNLNPTNVQRTFQRINNDTNIIPSQESKGKAINYAVDSPRVFQSVFTPTINIARRVEE